MIGVWGLQINTRMIAPYIPQYNLMGKYFAIQFVIILYKLQPAILNGLCYAIESWTTYRIKHKFVENGKNKFIQTL